MQNSNFIACSRSFWGVCPFDPLKTMRDCEIQSTLNRLKSRKRLLDVLDTGTLCAIFLEIFAILVLLLPVLWPLAVVVVLVLGVFFWRSTRSGTRSLAESVDLHYGLKDRLLVASSILTRPEITPIERLQLSDAAIHARQVDPREVLPTRLPRHFRLLCGLSIVLLTVILLVTSSGSSASRPLADIDEKKETLVTLVQMEQTLTQAKQALSPEAVEVSLAEIGAALSTIRATQAAGQALHTGDLALASEELESLEWSSLTPSEREIIGRILQDAAEKIKERNLPQLSQLTEQLAEGILHGNLEAIQETVTELAAMIYQHGEMHRLLEGKLALLEEQKADLIAALNGGQGTQPSNTPSQSWGIGEGGNPLTGPATLLDTIRQPHQLSGLQGTGPSDIETIYSPEGTEETAKQPYIEIYRQALQAAETALETEPIPLRHRQVIRRYFGN